MARMIDASHFGEIMEQWKKDCLECDDQHGADVIADVILQLDDMPTLTQPNEPLTLEELREMDGDPVWVENKNNPALSGWGIMLENICSAYHDIFSIEQYNKTWIAYRRPPEGGNDVR